MDTSANCQRAGGCRGSPNTAAAMVCCMLWTVEKSRAPRDPGLDVPPPPQALPPTPAPAAVAMVCCMLRTVVKSRLRSPRDPGLTVQQGH